MKTVGGLSTRWLPGGKCLNNQTPLMKAWSTAQASLAKPGRPKRKNKETSSQPNGEQGLKAALTSTQAHLHSCTQIGTRTPADTHTRLREERSPRGTLMSFPPGQRVCIHPPVPQNPYYSLSQNSPLRDTLPTLGSTGSQLASGVTNSKTNSNDYTECCKFPNHRL